MVSPDGLTPDHIGRYRVLQELGSGGMGTVYLCDQQEPVKRRVAVKVIRPGLDSSLVLSRFAVERRALEAMDHHNVARVLDAGETEDGRPFFVMEHVRGVSITEYCDRHQLPVAERLRLVQQLCAGVQHAHQKGVLHRDLRPTNILVTRRDNEPVVKIIDFGFARATDYSFAEGTVFAAVDTESGMPHHTSPEQAGLGDLDVDARSDLYSIGAVTYELLTGATPHVVERHNRLAVAELRRAIREDPVPLPSARVKANVSGNARVADSRATEVRPLVRSLRGDLDWIVQKALEKDRTKRYQAAAELWHDLERYLEREPVLAAPRTAAYRARKFVARHRVPTLAALAIVLGVAIGGWVMQTGYVEAESRYVESERQRRRIDAALRDFDLLALAPTVAQLETAVPELLPAWPERLAAIEAWLGRANSVVRRLPELEAARRQLLEAAEPRPGSDGDPASPEVAALERTAGQLALLAGQAIAPQDRARLAARRALVETEAEQVAAELATRPVFGSAAQLVFYRALERLIERIERLRGSGGGIQRVERARRDARAIAARAASAQWQRAITAIAADERYEFLQLRPQSGLVPIGTNAAGLWEFGHVASGTVPPSVDAPPRSGHGLVFVLVPGSAKWVSASQGDRRSFRIAPFLLSKYELCFEQWQRLAAADPPSRFAPGTAVGPQRVGTRHPVETVSWQSADEVFRGYGLRLPTAAEWEYACVAGLDGPPPDLRAVANVADRAAVKLLSATDSAEWSDDFVVHAPTGSFAPNPWGLFDMHGNVWEWCLDPVLQSGELDLLTRVMRGGSCAAHPDRCQAWSTQARAIDHAQWDVGVRPARSIE